MTASLTRRDFLFYGGATVAGVTLGELGRRALARADARQAGWRPAGAERWATSVCRECPAACGLRVRLVDEVPVKLEGNPLCPTGRGRLCAKGQAGLEAYFDPDRLVGPARRVGKRGEDRWEPISWEAATTMLASHLSGAHTPASPTLVVAADEHGPLAAAWTRFWTGVGARVTWTACPTSARLRSRLAALTGVDREPVFDLEHASHVLSFGAPLVEDWLSPVWSQRSYGRFRRGPSRARGQLVQIDAHRSMTARKADEWLALAPDAQLVLAYGIASVIVRENRANAAFLESFGGTFTEFERQVVETHPPDEVAAATGVPVVTLLRVARELADSDQPLVVVATDASQALVDAVFALNALVGAFDRPGGVFASPAPPTEEPDEATQALRDITNGSVRPRVVVFRDASALRALSAPLNLEVLLEPAELVVSFSPYLDEAASVADLLMPAHTPLESWQGVRPAGALAAEVIALAPPAVPPRLDTRDPIAIVRALADTIGGDAVSACPWTGSEAVVGAEIDRVLALRRGTPFSEPFETQWMGELERGGWWVPVTDAHENFARLTLEAGGWIDPYFEPGAVRESLRARGGFTFPAPRAKGRPTTVRPAGAPFSPSAAQARANESAFPLRLVPFVPAAVGMTGGLNHPALFELLGQPESAPWRVWAELNPETARTLGIESGMDIRIMSAGGAVMTALARTVEGTAPDTVAVAFVPASPRGGRWARLVDADVRPLMGGSAEGCQVRVSRA